MKSCCPICTTLLFVLFALNTSFAQQSETATTTWSPILGASVNVLNSGSSCNKAKTTTVAKTVSTKKKAKNAECCDIQECIKKGCKPSSCVKSTATKASNKSVKATFASQKATTKKATCQKKCTKTCQKKAKSALKN